MGVTFSRKSATRIVEAVRHIERIRVGGAKHRRPLLPTEDHLELKITDDVSPGNYTARRFTRTNVVGGTLSAEASLGTLADADDLEVWEIASIGLASALPLVGLITTGRVIGWNTSTELPIVVIPPPGIRRLRWNGTDNTIEVAYVSSPTEDQWIEQVAFYECTPP